MPRLAKGAETSICMAFLVMCAEKIRWLLRIIFVTVFAWVYAWQWPGCLWMALRHSYLLEDNRIAGYWITVLMSCIRHGP
jgi:hypothetical protein